MTFKEVISHLKKSPKDAWYYIQGNVRQRVFDSRFRWLIRTHIREQYQWRRDHAAVKCAANGECLCCGCSVPELFFAAKPCSVSKLSHCKDDGLKECYGPILSRKNWNQFKKYLQK